MVDFIIGSWGFILSHVMMFAAGAWMGSQCLVGLTLSYHGLQSNSEGVRVALPSWGLQDNLFI